MAKASDPAKDGNQKWFELTSFKDGDLILETYEPVDVDAKLAAKMPWFYDQKRVSEQGPDKRSNLDLLYFSPKADERIAAS